MREWCRLSSSPLGGREKPLHIIRSAQHNSQADGNIQERELLVNVISPKHTQARASLELLAFTRPFYYTIIFTVLQINHQPSKHLYTPLLHHTAYPFKMCDHGVLVFISSEHAISVAVCLSIALQAKNIQEIIFWGFLSHFSTSITLKIYEERIHPCATNDQI